MKPLTVKAIEALKGGPKRVEIPDLAAQGLYIVVQPSGSKSWAVRYRFNGKPAKITIGRYPALGLAEARIAATQTIESVERGIDPAAERKATKSAIATAQSEQRDRIGYLFEQYDRQKLSTLKSAKVTRRELQRHFVDRFEHMKISAVTRADIRGLLQEIAASGRGVTANRVRAYTSAFFAWCVEAEVLAVNPAAGIKPLVKEIAKDRFLDDREIALLWNAAETLGHPWGSLAKMLVLTGQRLNEVARMPIDEVRFGVWSLPPERVKNKHQHDVPLSPLAEQVCQQAWIASGSGTYVFSTTGGSAPLGGFNKGLRALQAEMQKTALHRIEHWTFHDLRRTTATGMARLGVNVRTTETVLNHVAGTLTGVARVYQRHDHAQEKRAALNLWADHIAHITGAKP